MTLTNANRKRPRSCEEEGCEFMPISKRISNLHIRATYIAVDHVNAQEEVAPQHRCDPSASCQAMDSPVHNCCNETHHDATFPVGAVPVPGVYPFSNTYSPEMDSTQNPHYYHINSLLFEVHMLRMQRLARVHEHLMHRM